ncbi:MAG: hypothetical protein INR62_06965 [Rhodospirillales bacterium]|nr:hypothetical protein [Acetobacter sp.]
MVAVVFLTRWWSHLGGTLNLSSIQYGETGIPDVGTGKSALESLQKGEIFRRGSERLLASGNDSSKV